MRHEPFIHAEGAHALRRQCGEAKEAESFRTAPEGFVRCAR
jgi:hypothetical protein